MKGICKRILACVLCGALMLGISMPAMAAQDTVYTTCGGECGYCPSIVIPGLFQSQTRMYDENGNVVTDKDGDPLTQLFVQVTTADIVRYALKAILPLTASLVLQADVGLSETVADIVTDVLDNNAKDNEGHHIQNIDVIRYPQSVARCTQEGKDYIYGCIPLEGYSPIAGEDHLYFFTYDSFDSISDLADELFAFIQQVKRETGHDKVNLVPISQGGSIANELMERYREELARDLHRMIFIVPALDGSYLIGKIFSDGFVKEGETLYSKMMPRILKDEDEKAEAYALNLALRLLPKSTLHRILDRTVDKLRNAILVNATTMWALTPSSEYPTLFTRYLADGSRESLRAELDFFHRAQTHSRENILYLQKQGVEVFDLVNYDHYFYPLFDGWEDYNADGIIHLDSTSAGAVSAAIHKTLPENYVQQGTYCTCGGSHISPDRKVDASAGALCETTFYFDEGDHESTGRNDVIIALAIELLTNDNFKNVHSYPDRYPQFNTARDTKELRSTLRRVRDIDRSALSAADAAELDAAASQCEAMLAQTVVNVQESEQAEARLNAILVRIGRKEPPEEMTERQIRLTAFLQRLSDWTYRVLGPRGFADVIRFQH